MAFNIALRVLRFTMTGAHVLVYFGSDTATITKWKNIIAAAFDFSSHWQKFKQGLSSVVEW
ncbi:hypothetical protein, partial [Bartonella sp. AA2SXKL]